MQEENNCLKATRMTKETKTPKHWGKKKNEILNCFLGIVQNPDGKDGKNCRLGLQNPQWQHCWYSLHISVQ